MDKKRVESLTFFRFVAAVIVVISHHGKEATGFEGILIAGSPMVTFFFVLSGFVMGLSYFNKNHFKAKSYLWARWARIAPVYLLSLMLLLVSSYIVKQNISPTSLVLSILFLQSWLPPHPLSINPPAWSLSVEAFFYLSFPFILLFIKKYNLSGIRMLFLSMLIWGVTQVTLMVILSTGFYDGFPSLSYDFVYFFPLFHFCSFILGVSAGVWFISTKTTIQSLPISIIVITGSTLLVIFSINNQLQIENYTELKIAFNTSFFAPLFLVFIISLAICETKFSKILSAKPLILLGNASYSVYILQLPVYQIYRHFLSGYSDLSLALDFYAYLFFLTIISILCFLLFEKPANTFIRFSLPKLINKW